MVVLCILMEKGRFICKQWGILLTFLLETRHKPVELKVENCMGILENCSVLFGTLQQFARTEPGGNQNLTFWKPISPTAISRLCVLDCESQLHQLTIKHKLSYSLPCYFNTEEMVLTILIFKHTWYGLLSTNENRSKRQASGCEAGWLSDSTDFAKFCDSSQQLVSLSKHITIWSSDAILTSTAYFNWFY